MTDKSVCEKTISGTHLWIKHIWDILSGETSGSIQYSNPYEVNMCKACGMIDDRDLEAEPKREEK